MPIPGTTLIGHLEENLCALTVTLAPELVARLEACVNERTGSGARYSASNQAEIDTEIYPSGM